MEYKYRKSFALPNGKRKNIRSNDKADFERKCAEVRRMLDGGVDVSDDTKVVDLFQQWFDTKRPYLRQSSIEAEKHIINKHLLPEWFACKKVKDVKPAHITTLMCEASDLAKSTQSKMLIILRSAFTYAVDNGIILKSPVLSSHKARGASKEEVKPLSIQQSKALLDATRGTRAYVPVALMLGCGLRRGEVCGLRWSDVDIENGLLHVRNTIDLTPGKEQFQETTKTEAGRRDIPMPDWLVPVLREAKSQSVSVFVVCQTNGKHHTNSSWKNMWKLVQRREITSTTKHEKHTDIKRTLDFHCHPHQLRHTCITRWVESGMGLKEVQYLAGHSSMDMTMNVYAHYDKATRFEETKRKVSGLNFYD